MSRFFCARSQRKVGDARVCEIVFERSGDVISGGDAHGLHDELVASALDARDELESPIAVEQVLAQRERPVLRGGDDTDDACASTDGGDFNVVPAVSVDAHDLWGRPGVRR